VLVNLAALGIDMNNDGTLTVNTVATDTRPSLASVLATNPSAVQSFFQNVSGTGFAQNSNNDLVNLTDVTDGIFNFGCDCGPRGFFRRRRPRLRFCALGLEGINAARHARNLAPGE
jgi:hypothetical protein